MRASSSRAISVFNAQGEEVLAPGNRARLSASRRGGGAGGRAASRDDEPDGNGGGRHHHRPRDRLRDGPGSARRARKRRCARNGCGRSRSNSNGWPTTPATSARWPATWRFCRPSVRVRQNSRRFSQPHRADLRQPFRPRPGAARRLPPRSRTRTRGAVAAPRSRALCRAGRRDAQRWRSTRG